MTVKYGVSITLENAKKVAKAAEERAEQIGVPMVISILDASANPVLLYRMQDALLVSIDVAINKAFTAVTNKVATHELTPLLQPGAVLYGLQNTNSNRIVTFGGGYLLMSGDEIIGAIGVSGGAVSEDMDVASYALKAL